jgi:hypothetical protein
MREALWSAGKPRGRSDYDLARIAVDAIARNGAKISNLGRAIQPCRKERGHNMITGYKLCDPPPHRFNDARTVGHGDSTHVLKIGTANHSKIMVVQGTAVQADADLASARILWFGYIDDFEVIKPAGRANLHSLHSVLLDADRIYALNSFSKPLTALVGARKLAPPRHDKRPQRPHLLGAPPEQNLNRPAPQRVGATD